MTTRQKIDPATKAQVALDVAKVDVPPLIAARDYAAANPALPGALTVGEATA